MPATESPRRTQRVTAYGLLSDGPQVLLARSSALAAIPGRWYLPGGGVDFGESPAECVVREFAEETGLTVVPVELQDVVADVTALSDLFEEVHTVRVLFRVSLVGGTLRPEVAGTTDAVDWYSVATAMTMPLMPFVRRALSTM